MKHIRAFFIALLSMGNQCNLPVSIGQAEMPPVPADGVYSIEINISIEPPTERFVPLNAMTSVSSTHGLRLIVGWPRATCADRDDDTFDCPWTERCEVTCRFVLERAVDVRPVLDVMGLYNENQYYFEHGDAVTITVGEWKAVTL